MTVIMLVQGVGGVSLSQPYPLTVADCRGLVKTLVCGMKTITWGVGACKAGRCGLLGMEMGVAFGDGNGCG